MDWNKILNEGEDITNHKIQEQRIARDFDEQLYTKKSDNLAAATKSLHSCTTLCDPIDGSPPGSPVPGILQARTLEWVAISFSSKGKWKVKVRPIVK